MFAILFTEKQQFNIIATINELNQNIDITTAGTSAHSIRYM